jgi:hypothetical protein
MSRRTLTLCRTCSKPLIAARRDARFCSNRCRQRAHYSDSKPLGKSGPRILGGSTPGLDSNVLTTTDSILSDARSARTDPKTGKVLCAICSLPTRQEPVILRVPDTAILQVVPVYHSDCAAR